MSREPVEKYYGLRHATDIGTARWHGPAMQLVTPLDRIPAHEPERFITTMEAVPTCGWMDNVTWNAKVARKQRTQDMSGLPYRGPPIGRFQHHNQEPVNRHLRLYMSKLRTKDNRKKRLSGEAFTATADVAPPPAALGGDEAAMEEDAVMEDQMEEDANPIVEEDEGIGMEESDDEDEASDDDGDAFVPDPINGFTETAPDEDEDVDAFRRAGHQLPEARIPPPEEFDRLRSQLLSIRGLIQEGVANARSNKFTSAYNLGPEVKIPNYEHGIFKFKDYQRDAIGRWEYLMRKFHAVLLGDEMGLGKTAVVMGVIQRLVDAATAMDRSVLCGLVIPNALIKDWKKHLKQSKTIRWCVYENSIRNLSAKQLKQKFDAVIIPTGVLSRVYQDLDTCFNHRQALKEGLGDEVVRLLGKPLETDATFDGTPLSLILNQLIIDEAHSIRNPITHLAQAVHAMPAHGRVAITGTPLQNTLAEFGAMLMYLRIQPFCNQGLFRAVFTSKTTIGKKLKPETRRRNIYNDATLAAIRSCICIRRVKDQEFNGEAIGAGIKPHFTWFIEGGMSRETAMFQKARRDLWDIKWRNAQKKKDAEDLDLGITRKSRLPKRTTTERLTELSRAKMHIIHPMLLHAKYGDDKPDPNEYAKIVSKVEVDPDDVRLIGEVLGELKKTAELSNAERDKLSAKREEFLDWFRSKRVDWKSDRIVTTLTIALERLKEHNEAAMALPAGRERNHYIATHKILIFCEYMPALDLLGLGLESKGIKYLRYDGSISQARRDEIRSQFEEEGKV